MAAPAVAAGEAAPGGALPTLYMPVDGGIEAASGLLSAAVSLTDIVSTGGSFVASSGGGSGASCRNSGGLLVGRAGPGCESGSAAGRPGPWPFSALRHAGCTSRLGKSCWKLDEAAGTAKGPSPLRGCASVAARDCGARKTLLTG